MNRAVTVQAEPSALSAAVATPRHRVRHAISATAQLVALCLLIAVVLVPIYWMISTSLKTTNQTFAIPPVFVFEPTIQHYRAVFHETGVPHSLLNSIIVATGSTVLSLVLGTPAAYALARFQFRGRSDLWFWFISNRFISPIVVALPVFLLARNLGLLNTRLALVLIYLTFNVPLVIWLCVDQFRMVPREVDDAALVDGAGRWRILVQIALPLALPGVVVSAILCFIFSWNEFLFSLILTREQARTAPVEAAGFMTGMGILWGQMMATGTLIVLPVVVFAAIVSRHLVRGLTMGAIK